MAFLLVIALGCLILTIVAGLFLAAWTTLRGPEPDVWHPSWPTDFRAHPHGDRRLQAWAGRREADR